MIDDINYYQILGVENTASPEEIKEAYRFMSKATHPDKVGSAGEVMFNLIGKAKEILLDDKMRKEYDLQISSGEENSPVQVEVTPMNDLLELITVASAHSIYTYLKRAHKEYYQSYPDNGDEPTLSIKPIDLITGVSLCEGNAQCVIPPNSKPGDMVAVKKGGSMVVSSRLTIDDSNPSQYFNAGKAFVVLMVNPKKIGANIPIKFNYSGSSYSFVLPPGSGSVSMVATQQNDNIKVISIDSRVKNKINDGDFVMKAKRFISS